MRHEPAAFRLRALLMKPWHYIVVFVVAIASVGCRPDVRSPESTRLATNVNAREMQKEVQAAARDYAAVSKDLFVAALSRRLAEFDQKIGDLGKHVELLKTDSRIECSRMLDALMEQRVRLGRKFEELRRSGAESGNEVRAGLRSAMAELERSCEELRGRYME